MILAQKGEVYRASFDSLPLGFTIIHDGNERNAKVSAVKFKGQKAGVRIGSHVISVNDVDVWGKDHDTIVRLILNAKPPIILTFRHVCHNDSIHEFGSYVFCFRIQPPPLSD